MKPGVSSRLIRSAVLLAPLFLCALPVRSDPTLQVTPGIDRFCRTGSWTPVCVRLGGTSRAGDARLRLVSRGRAGTRVVEMPIRLTGASISEQHTLYFRPIDYPANEVFVELAVDGRVAASKKIEGLLPIEEDQPAVLCLTSDRSGLGTLSAGQVGYPHRTLTARSANNYNMGMGPSSRSYSARILYPVPSALPDSSAGYDAVDAVALGDIALETMTDAQWSALREWVRDGGTLLVSGGVDLARLRRKELADLLPLDPQAVRSLPSLAGLAGAYGSSPAISGQVPVVEGSVRAGALSLASQSGTPLVLGSRFGEGLVVFTAFDLFSPELRAWRGSIALWREVLKSGQADQQMAEMMRQSVESGEISESNGYGQERNQLVDALAGLRATEAPSFLFIGVFLFGYIVVLVPVNYFILRRLDKKELAWLTAPAIVAVFTLGAYGIGSAVKGGDLDVKYACVLEAASDQPEFHAYTVATVFSPRQARYSVTVADPDAQAGEMVSEYWSGQRTGTELVVERDRSVTVRNALINMWDHRSFHFEGHTALGNGVRASIGRARNGMAVVTVTNNTGVTLAGCALLRPGSTTPVGALAPGASLHVQIPIEGAQNSQGLAQIAAMSTGLTPSQLRLQSSLVGMLASTESLTRGNAPLALIGWTTQPVTGVRLEGEHPRLEGVDMVVVHLPSPNGALSYAPAPGPMSASRNAPLPAGSPAIGMSGAMGSGSGMTSGVTPANAATLNSEAYNLANQGRLDDALKTALRALKLAPKDGSIADSVAEMYQRKKDYRSAAAYYKKALKLQPGQGSVETHAKYGETLAALGKKPEAIAQLKFVTANPANPWAARAKMTLDRLHAGH